MYVHPVERTEPLEFTNLDKIDMGKEAIQLPEKTAFYPQGGALSKTKIARTLPL